VWIEPKEVALLAQHGLWYRVDFRREFGDGARDAVNRLLTDAKVRYLPILIWDDKRPTTLPAWEAWKTYVKHVVGRYPQHVYWQIWNEPNNERVPNTYFDNNLHAWRGFLRRTATYIKDVNPEAKVVSGGIAVGGHGAKRIREYWSQWFNVNELVDRVAIHTYVSDPEAAARAINNASRVADQPVWCTELGRKSTVDGEAQQAEWFRRVRDLTHSVPLFWYDLQDVDGAFDGFGALRRDGTAKPVWRSIVGS